MTAAAFAPPVRAKPTLTRVIVVSARQRLSGGDSLQVTAGGVVENAPVAGHECSVRHPRGGNDQPISRVAMECLGKQRRLDCDLWQQGLD